MASIALVVLVVVAACTPAARVLTGEQTGLGQVFTVVVDDRTGWIKRFEFVQPEMGQWTSLDVGNPEGEPSVLRVSWVGGGCELTATITVDQAIDRLRLRLIERPVCQDQMGIGRVIDLVFDREIPADSVDIDRVVP